MPIINKNDLKQLSSNTFIPNSVGAITPQTVDYFQQTLIDSLVDETGYIIDSGSWNNSLSQLSQSVAAISYATGGYVTNSQTASMSVASASWVDLRGKGVVINYGPEYISITGSDATDTPTIVCGLAANIVGCCGACSSDGTPQSKSSQT